MLTGLQLDVFSVLGDGMKTSAEVAAAIDVNPQKINALMYATCVGGALVLLPFYIAESIWFEPVIFSWPVLAAVIFMAAVPTLTRR